MRVKRLEIHGFKSFKDKTVIHFDHTITGIVGPNGCGKSNIVDVLFWVMGEQSYKHMRGSGSEDLIFNGSSKYQALGMAEATLVMETGVVDAETTGAGATASELPVHLKHKEVSVTRRVYRGGEGEYFINGVPARLKDIQELFMDTGVGAKGYSVIEQGQIGKIVNAKPEERRLLIEEAAGIAKYKARKKESLRKMEATQLNLSRLNDVVQEIERNLASLERQAQKARQYKKYKDELLDKEMTWGRRKTLVLRQRLDSLKQEREILEQELIALRAELQTAENTMETDRVDQVTDTKQAEELQAQVQMLSDELTQSKSALELSRKRQGDLTAQLTALEGERTDLTASLAVERERLEEREMGAQTLEESFSQESDRARSLDEEVRVARRNSDDARRTLESAKRELMSGIARSSDLTNRAASLAGKMESAQHQAEKLAAQVQLAAEKMKAAQEEAEQARTVIENVREQKEALTAERRGQGDRVREQEQALKALERTREESAKKATQLRSRLQSLVELAESHEGFGDGPKAALDWASAQGRSEQLRALADGLDVRSGYESALEGWLEQRLEDLVSEDASLAVGALSALRDGKKGRASVHLGMGSGSSVGGEKGASQAYAKVEKTLASCGFEIDSTLDEVVTVSASATESAGGIIRALTEGVVVVKSLAPLAGAEGVLAEGVSALLASLGGWSLVALDGSALSAEGVLRGGISSDANSAASVLGRKRAINELESQVTEAEAALSTIEQHVSETREALEIARARQQTLLTDLQTLEIQAAGFERDVQQSARAVRDAENDVERVNFEMETAREEAERAAADRAGIEAALGEWVSKREALEISIAEGDEKVVALESALREREIELQSLRVAEASLRERSSSLKRELESARMMIQDRERRLAEVERILERASREQQEHTGGDVGLESRIEELMKSLSTRREALSLVKDRLEKSSSQINGALNRIKALHAQGDEKTSQSNQLALEFEKISAEYTHLVQNLEEKYGPGCLERPVTSPIQEEMNEPIVTHEMSAEEELLLGEEVERLRERIRRLGEVNVMAIEEFEETKKRYDHLVTERQDLLHSIENLQDAIEHINKTSEDRFKRAFEAIADRFERLFPIVFGGGYAKLSLVYPEGSADILEAGVDILASPPGKKVVNIGLLSGGEKALTAVSLIFAIFMVKPSPFCVLDEVDAPLDDANIGKFNALLREMSAKSQFIIITHNKKTMELNDTLYGVTMEEPGVSKIVSIEIK